MTLLVLNFKWTHMQNASNGKINNVWSNSSGSDKIEQGTIFIIRFGGQRFECNILRVQLLQLQIFMKMYQNHNPITFNNKTKDEKINNKEMRQKIKQCHESVCRKKLSPLINHYWWFFKITICCWLTQKQ